MAEEERMWTTPPPAPAPAPAPAALPHYAAAPDVLAVKTEPSSPSSSDRSHSSYPYENGYNGLGSEDDSLDDADSKEDVPLDFSIRRRDRSEGDSGSEREPTALRSSPPTGHNTVTNTELYYAHHQRDEGRGLVSNGVVGTGSSPPALSPEAAQVASEPPLELSRPPVEHKIGEPQLALPGMVAGMPPGLVAAAGLLPGLPPGVLPAKAAAAMLGAFPLLEQQQQQQQRRSGQQTSPGLSPGATSPTNGKSTRPFKAYPKDPLSLPLGYYSMPSIPGVPPVDIAAAQAMSQNSEEMFKQYRDYVMKMQDQLRQQRATKPKQNGRLNNRRSSESSGSASPAPSQGSGSHMNGVMRSPTSAEPGAPSRKRGRTLPEEQKDEAYWERRRKNNDAAKRSRDSRRAKEDEIAIRAAFLEQENLKLRVELAALKNETAKLRCMLYNT